MYAGGERKLEVRGGGETTSKRRPEALQTLKGETERVRCISLYYIFIELRIRVIVFTVDG